MNTLRARCGSCEHIWDIVDDGFIKCPTCGSTKIDLPKSLGICLPKHIIQNNLIAQENSYPVCQDLNKVGKEKLLRRIFIVYVWSLLCAGAASLFICLSTPVAKLPISWFLGFAGAALAIKILLVLCAKSIVRGQPTIDIPLLPETSIEIVGYCVIEASWWLGYASLVSIWWPTGAICFLLTCVVHVAIILLSVLTQLSFKIPIDSFIVAIYTVVLSSCGYHLLHYLAGV